MFRDGVMVITLKRIWIAGLLCASAIIPIVAMSAFLFGCCALPFHRVVHRYLPICGSIVRFMTPDSHHESTPRKVVTKKHSPISIVATKTGAVTIRPTRQVSSATANRLRDQLSHGALRCDNDVGLLLLLSVMVI
jgi:hypothetical protein